MNTKSMPKCPKCHLTDMVRQGEMSFECDRPHCRTSFIPDPPAIRTLAEARLVLADCTREELNDYTFDDSEVYWFDREHNEVACGYYGLSSNGVTFFDGSDIDDPALELRRCGTFGSSQRNDVQLHEGVMSNSKPFKFGSFTDLMRITK